MLTGNGKIGGQIQPAPFSFGANGEEHHQGWLKKLVRDEQGRVIVVCLFIIFFNYIILSILICFYFYIYIYNFNFF
jgi:hypothetical protein